MDRELDFETNVIFRILENEVIALFPDIPANHSGNILSYMHIGQHGAADYHLLLGKTRLATPNEYNSLLTELLTMGYKLRVMKRLKSWT